GVQLAGAEDVFVWRGGHAVRIPGAGVAVRPLPALGRCPADVQGFAPRHALEVGGDHALDLDQACGIGRLDAGFQRGRPGAQVRDGVGVERHAGLGLVEADLELVRPVRAQAFDELAAV